MQIYIFGFAGWPFKRNSCGVFLLLLLIFNYSYFAFVGFFVYTGFWVSEIFPPPHNQQFDHFSEFKLTGNASLYQYFILLLFFFIKFLFLYEILHADFI